MIQAAANVIIADGKIDSGEFEVMQDIIQYLDNDTQQTNLLTVSGKWKNFLWRS